jgi:RNA polymerase sigma-70 factor (ECF subfamily)
MSDSHRDKLAQVFAESSARLRRRIRRFVGSAADADDAVQEAFLRAQESRESIRVPEAFLYMVARNAAFDQLRHERHIKREALGNIPSSGVESSVESVEQLLLADERTQVLKDAIGRLPPQCQTVFALKVFQGCSYKEIANTMGISVRTVEHHIARAIRDVYQQVRQRYDEGSGQDG